MMDDAQLSKLLTIDGLALAENITGLSYKEDKQTEALGMALFFAAGRKKQDALIETQDTHYSTTVTEFLEIAHKEGFEVVLSLPFTGLGYGTPCQETFYVLFHAADGILMKFDTFGGDHVNSGDFYYNWLPSQEDAMYHHCLSSGRYVEYGERLLWAGNHDTRIALRFNLRQLRANGEFITPWIEAPFLWLLHYMDSKLLHYDYRRIIAERIALLPENVRSAIAHPIEAETSPE